MVRSLSKTEAKIILELEWLGKKTITIREIMKTLNCSYNWAKRITYRLETKNWLNRIGRGKYILVSADSGKNGIPSTNALLIGNFLTEPYYFSYATSNSYHGFSTQVPSTVYIATTKTKRSVKIYNNNYRFVKLSQSKFFGYEDATIFDTKVKMANKEKSVIDSIDKMSYSGGLVEVACILYNAIRKIDVGKLILYACDMHSSSLLQRLGYLLDFLDIEHNQEMTLLKHMGKSIVYLDGMGPKKGRYNKKWHVICNVSDNILWDALR